MLDRLVPVYKSGDDYGNYKSRYCYERALKQLNSLVPGSLNTEAVHYDGGDDQPHQQQRYVPAAFYRHLLGSEHHISCKHVQEHDYRLPEYDQCDFHLGSPSLSPLHLPQANHSPRQLLIIIFAVFRFFKQKKSGLMAG